MSLTDARKNSKTNIFHFSEFTVYTSLVNYCIIQYKRLYETTQCA